MHKSAATLLKATHKAKLIGNERINFMNFQLFSQMVRVIFHHPRHHLFASSCSLK